MQADVAHKVRFCIRIRVRLRVAIRVRVSISEVGLSIKST